MPELNEIFAIGKIRLAPADAPLGRSFTSTPALLDAFTEADLIRGDISPDPVTGGVTVNTTEDYELSLLLSAEWQTGDELGLQLWLNGAAFGATWYQQGRGSGRPIIVDVRTILPLAAGDTIQVYAHNADAGTLNATIHACALTVRKV